MALLCECLLEEFEMDQGGITITGSHEEIEQILYADENSQANQVTQASKGNRGAFRFSLSEK